MDRRYRPIIISLAIVLVIAIGWIARPLQPTLSKPVVFEVERGTTLTEVIDQLARAQHLNHPLLLRLLARLRYPGHLMQAGQYQFTATTTPLSLLDNLMHGKVVVYAFTIVEGWHFAQLAQALSHADFLGHTDNLARVWKKTMQGHLPEGQFFPTTYHYPAGYRDIDLLVRAHGLLQQHLQHAWQQRADGLPYQNPQQALIVASLIEKESAHPQDRRHISAVIANRLRKHMRLQIDPTVRYALKRFDGRLHHRDMKVKSPYNTYVVHGLPPTPIALPSLDSINAALHPLVSDDLYFVAKANGRHVFSATLKDHQLAVKRCN